VTSKPLLAKPKGFLDIESRGLVSKCSGKVSALEFRRDVLMIASTDRRLAFYKTSGDSYDELTSVLFKDMPIQCARLSIEGNEIIVSGKKPYYYRYDIEAEKGTRVNIGIWGR